MRVVARLVDEVGGEEGEEEEEEGCVMAKGRFRGGRFFRVMCVMTTGVAPGSSFKERAWIWCRVTHWLVGKSPREAVSFAAAVAAIAFPVKALVTLSFPCMARTLSKSVVCEAL